MSLIIAIRSPIVGSQGFDVLTRLVASLANQAGGEVLSMNCLAQLINSSSDEGQMAKTFEIKEAAESAGGTVISMSCLNELVNNSWQ